MVWVLWQDVQPTHSTSGSAVSKGVLYVVATPIGNLGDISMRAVEILREVDLIAAEDTRHTKPLLRHYAIDTPMQSFHEHNERAQVAKLTEVLQSGRSVALVSDAGTPLISDPGFPLVREAAGLGIRIVPVPGPSAIICALSAAGLPTDRFLFAGFPPRNQGQRRDWLGELIRERATLVFYESSHRIVASLKAMVEVFGGEREAVIAREVTKLHETFLRGSLDELLSQVEQDENQRKGEFVILVAGAPAGSTGVQAEIV
ncbi:MAG: 16S rRNA (cytidine(1402)-2'-O)-methyltransferase, partial [Candidatus Thiodiazotropha sp. (ex Myrtea spinifera)]|nr:16S rRNA (cytidine(1402)-2'-O)-methyltransferase [Candidatus Thiodiazotropha sp. (ex Myrtea spinifera)]